MFFTIHIISKTEAIVPVVELLEWGRGTIALHSKGGSSTMSSINVVASYVITSMSLFTLCHSKTVASMGGVTSINSGRWWHPLGGGVVSKYKYFFFDKIIWNRR